MKRLLLALLGAGALALAFASLALWAVTNSDYSPQRFASSMHVIRQRINLLTVHQGYISQEGVYHTNAEVINVWRWYAGQFNAAPPNGMNPEGQCVRLAKTTHYIVIRRTVEVMLCSVARGTRVFFNQTVYLGP